MSSTASETPNATRDWVSVEPSILGPFSRVGLRNIAVVGKEVDRLLQSLALDQPIDDGEKMFWGIDYSPRGLTADQFAEHHNMDLLVIKMHRLQEHYGVDLPSQEQIKTRPEALFRESEDKPTLSRSELSSNTPDALHWILRHYAFLARNYATLQFGTRHSRGQMPQHWLIAGDGIPENLRPLVKQTTVAPGSWQILREDNMASEPVRPEPEFPDMLAIDRDRLFESAVRLLIEHGRNETGDDDAASETIHTSSSDRSFDSDLETETEAGDSPIEPSERLAPCIKEEDMEDVKEDVKEDVEEDVERGDIEDDKEDGIEDDKEEDKEDEEAKAAQTMNAIREAFRTSLAARMTAPQKRRPHKADGWKARSRLALKGSKVAGGNVSKRSPGALCRRLQPNRIV